MKQFGTDEYGNREGFKIICNKCGKEGWVVPVTHHEDSNPEFSTKIYLEFRCSCGNLYGGTIFSHT